MRKITLLLSFLFVVLGLSAQTNLVTNPSFESDFTGWTKGPTNNYTEPVVKTGGAQDGNKYVEYTAASATTGFYQDIPVTVGKDYIITFWYKASGDGTDARIWSLLLDAGGGAVYTTPNADTDPLRTNNGYLPEASVWTKHEVNFTVPTAVVNLRLAFRAYTGGTVAFDNISLVEAGATNEPSLSVSPASLSFSSSLNVASASQKVTITGANLDAAPTATITGADAAMFSQNGTLTAAGGELDIVFTPTSEGNKTAALTITSGSLTETVALSGITVAAGQAPDVIISEIYGGGGNSNAPYSHDYVELYNTTNADIDISGWSIQYFSATGTTVSTGNIFVLPSGATIPANKHFLIQCAVGANTDAAALPTPDAAAAEGMTMSGTNAKLVLMTNNQTITISDLTSIIGNENFKDYVHTGTATPIWGSALAAMSNTMSATRKAAGGTYQYTPDVGADFEIIAPNPQNSSNVLSGINGVYESLTLYTSSGKIHFNASAGETVEVFNTMGQKVYNALTTDGENEISVSLKGIAIVKVGNRTGKVIL